jgi:hemolysin activation/secretion protein
LNLRDFEQGLDQINRLSSNSATIEVLSGDQPGESVVVVHNRVSSPWHFNLSVDNQGSESTGKLQAGATISLDNPLRMNDFVSYTRRETIPANRDTQGSVSDSLSYVLPFGRSTLSANLNQSHYNSRINTAAGTSVQNSGESTNQTLRLDRVLYRDASTRWNMFAGFTAKESNSYLAGILLAGSRRLSVLDLGVSANTLLLGGALSVDLGMARGSQAFNALRDADGLLDSDPRAQFQKWVMSGSYSRPFELFGHELQFSSQWAAQYAEDVLYGSEQMLIGGIYTVRGFDKSSLSGDHGAYIRNEIGMRMPFSNGDLRGTLRPWIGLDCGVSGSRNTGVPEGTLTGLALGVQTSIGSAVSFDIFASKPLKLPDALARESTALWARLNINL